MDDFSLHVHGKICARRQDESDVDITGRSVRHHALERRLDLTPIVWMHRFKECLESSSKILWAYADEPEGFMGSDEPVRGRVPFPIP